MGKKAARRWGHNDTSQHLVPQGCRFIPKDLLLLLSHFSPVCLCVTP